LFRFSLIQNAFAVIAENNLAEQCGKSGLLVDTSSAKLNSLPQPGPTPIFFVAPLRDDEPTRVDSNQNRTPTETAPTSLHHSEQGISTTLSNDEYDSGEHSKTSQSENLDIPAPEVRR
jgi:hypothetical protein